MNDMNRLVNMYQQELKELGFDIYLYEYDGEPMIAIKSLESLDIMCWYPANIKYAYRCISHIFRTGSFDWTNWTKWKEVLHMSNKLTKRMIENQLNHFMHNIIAYGDQGWDESMKIEYWNCRGFLEALELTGHITKEEHRTQIHRFQDMYHKYKYHLNN